MQMATWRQCAEYYLTDVWCSDDRHLIPEFSSRSVTCEMLHDLCIRYGVARTIRGHIEELGVNGKYGPFAEMLNRYRNTVMTRANVPFIIDREVENLRVHYGGQGIWSAISKAFWMMKQHPVIIYDNFAWNGLQELRLSPGNDTYRQYFDSWFRFFERKETKDKLGDALGSLPNSRSSQILIDNGTLDAAQLKRLIDSEWFPDRVTDIWLCCHGGANWIDAEQKPCKPRLGSAIT